MATRHAKSPCCRERVRRFGKRRRQCSRCKRTWRVRKKRFGRKRSRVSKFLLARILLEHHTLTQEAKRLGVAQSVASKRMRLALLSVVSRQFHISPRGRCILLADGLYFRFKREHIVMYLMALRPTKSSQAYFLDPVFVKGRERLEAWREALEHIPLPIKKRIVAFVSDGFRGGAALAQEHGWVQQRCHFHMLAALSGKRGRKPYRLPNADIRGKLLEATRVLLVAKHSGHVEKARRTIQDTIRSGGMPEHLRKHAVDLLENLLSFRAHIAHPELDLPTTTNAVESMGRMVRKATRTARTPESVLLRATALLRLKKSIVCNGNHQPS